MPSFCDFHPHLTHALQPLDQAVFGEVKRQQNKKHWRHARLSREKIKREKFPAKIRVLADISKILALKKWV